MTVFSGIIYRGKEAGTDGKRFMVMDDIPQYRQFTDGDITVFHGEKDDSEAIIQADGKEKKIPPGTNGELKVDSQTRLSFHHEGLPENL